MKYAEKTYWKNNGFSGLGNDIKWSKLHVSGIPEGNETKGQNDKNI